MKAKSGFLQTWDGHNSSTRLLGFSVTMYALLMSTVLLIVGITSGVALMLIATSAGTIFTTVAGPAMVYLFTSKAQENSKEEAIRNEDTKQDNLQAECIRDERLRISPE